jgi:hypothetical protein
MKRVRKFEVKETGNNFEVLNDKAVTILDGWKEENDVIVNLYHTEYFPYAAIKAVKKHFKGKNVYMNLR